MRKYVVLITAALLSVTSLLTACAGDSTPPARQSDWFGALPWELPDDAVPMRVDKVHDGDSINLTQLNDDWYERYRIIGIQAPEIEGFREEECYGPESAEFVKQLLPAGTTVWIQQDISNTDPNGRFLRHIFVEDGDTGEFYLLSEVLVRGGYARQRSYPPDDLYDDVLIEAQEDAWDTSDGMWNCEEWESYIDD